MSKENNNNEDNVDMLNQQLKQELEELRSDQENNASEDFYSNRRSGKKTGSIKKRKRQKSGHSVC
ncbi:MAG: hypothetical protein LUF92_14920 [Clostridiales bacterium]|nr:hypothetical protein [Clostridiales bacterium]